MTPKKDTADTGQSGRRCPISFALDMFGDRWSLLLVRDMTLFGKQRYSEFLASPEGISTNILADRLRQMQQRGLVDKFHDPSDRKAVLYLLSDKGLDLFPVLFEVIRWGLAYDANAIVSEDVARALTTEGDPLYDNVRRRIQAQRAALQAQ